MDQRLQACLANTEACHYDNPAAWILELYYDDVLGYRSAADNETYWTAPEVRLPVPDRPSGIAAAIEACMQRGTDLSTAGDGWYPLTFAVLMIDPLMVRWLIQQGADCRKWDSEDEPAHEWEQNWYIEHIDVAALNAPDNSANREQYIQDLLETAYVLVHDGGLTEEFHGLLLDITEERIMIYGSLNLKY